MAEPEVDAAELEVAAVLPESDKGLLELTSEMPLAAAAAAELPDAFDMVEFAPAFVDF